MTDKLKTTFTVAGIDSLGRQVSVPGFESRNHARAYAFKKAWIDYHVIRD